MFSRLLRRRLTVWIAMLAILFSALAPAVSHALEIRNSSAAWVQICTMNGTMTVALDDNGQQKPVKDALQHHMENCPYCTAHGGPLGLPPSPSVSFAVLGGHDVFPALFYTAPAVLFSWSAASPRGPPSLA